MAALSNRAGGIAMGFVAAFAVTAPAPAPAAEKLTNPANDSLALGVGLGWLAGLDYGDLDRGAASTTAATLVLDLSHYYRTSTHWSAGVTAQAGLPLEAGLRDRLTATFHPVSLKRDFHGLGISGASHYRLGLAYARREADAFGFAAATGLAFNLPGGPGRQLTVTGEGGWLKTQSAGREIYSQSAFGQLLLGFRQNFRPSPQ